jgi:hypothetical protein
LILVNLEKRVCAQIDMEGKMGTKGKGGKGGE